MDLERPRLPKCFLGCGNVRTWSLIVCNIEILFLIIILLEQIISFPKWPMIASVVTTFIILGLNINIKLRNGVVKCDIAPIRLWLGVYSIMFGFIAFVIIFGTTIIVYADYNHIADHQREKGKFILIIVECTISECITAFAYYPVYQYYLFEKSRL